MYGVAEAMIKKKVSITMPLAPRSTSQHLDALGNLFIFFTEL